MYQIWCFKSELPMIHRLDSRETLEIGQTVQSRHRSYGILLSLPRQSFLFPHFPNNQTNKTKGKNGRTERAKKSRKPSTLSHEASGSNNFANLKGDKCPFWCCCGPFNFTDFPSFMLQNLWKKSTNKIRLKLYEIAKFLKLQRFVDYNSAKFSDQWCLFVEQRREL